MRCELWKAHGTGCCVCPLLKIGQRLKASRGMVSGLHWRYDLEQAGKAGAGKSGKAGAGTGLEKSCVFSILFLTVFFPPETFCCWGVGGSQ